MVVTNEKLKRRMGGIDTHHINFNRKDNSMWNLAVLCSFCHQAIHKNGVKTRFKKGYLPYSQEVI